MQEALTKSTTSVKKKLRPKSEQMINQLQALQIFVINSPFFLFFFI